MEDSARRTANEIFDTVVHQAEDEVHRSVPSLAFSGVVGGLMMGLTPLGVALTRIFLGDGEAARLASYALYPLGFVAVIIGRGQLFTENTLYPVVLALHRKGFWLRTLRLWAIVLAANVAGVFLFGALAARSGGLRPETVDAISRLGSEAVQTHGAHLFWSAVFGGWLIALVAWQVAASQWTIAQIAMTWAIAFVVGAAQMAHSIAGSAEIAVAVLHHSVSLFEYAKWFFVTVAGNIVGGTMLVSLLFYGQVHREVKAA